jgi:hypothetical protein
VRFWSVRPPTSPGVGPCGTLSAPGMPPPLHAAAVDVVPDPERDAEPAGVGHGDQSVQRVEVAPLLPAGQADHAHVGELLDVEEVRIAGRQEAAVLVAEDDDQGVEAVPHQQVQVTGPVIRIVEATFPVGPVHGVNGQGPLPHVRPLGGLPHLGQRRAGVGTPADAVRHVQFGVHHPAVVRAGDQPDRFAVPGGAPDDQRLGPPGGGMLARLEQAGGRPAAFRTPRDDQELATRRLERDGVLAGDALAAQGLPQLLRTMTGRGAGVLVRNKGDDGLGSPGARHPGEPGRTGYGQEERPPRPGFLPHRSSPFQAITSWPRSGGSCTTASPLSRVNEGPCREGIR